jgi:dGTPase
VEALLTRPSEERRKGFAERRWGVPENEPAAKSYRTPQQRDRDRVLYCSAFQRLAYVTQVTAPESGHTLHNRLSHSLKVAQVGRRNAERLQSMARAGEIDGSAAELVNAVDPDGVEAACLAHDLGHPPFGHIAEWVLNRIAREEGLPDGFEGNAQSFRIVTRLAVQDDSSQGLDLTRGTLDGVLKYPWRHLTSDPAASGKREHKWGYYADDAEAYRFARRDWPEENDDELPERSFQAHLMDWADDLTYAVHDMDDFFRAGLIPFDRLNEKGSTELRRFKDLLLDAKQADWQAFPDYDPDVIVEAAREALSLHGIDEPYRHVRNSRAAMRAFGSELITRYLQAFSVEDAGDSSMVALKIDAQRRCEVEALKMLVTVYVVRHPGLAVVQHGQKRLIEDLFGWYYKATDPDKKKGDRRLLPPGAKERIETADDTASARARVVADLIAGMTESSAIQLHRRLSGGWTAPTLDATAVMG